MWPAFWLLPQSGAWPPEIDVVELVDVMTASYHTLHYLSNGVHEVHRVSTTCLPEPFYVLVNLAIARVQCSDWNRCGS